MKKQQIVLLRESNHIIFYINFQSPRRFNEGNRGDDRILQLTEIHRQQLAELKQRNEKLQEEKASMEMYNYSKINIKLMKLLKYKLLHFLKTKLHCGTIY